MMGMVAKPGDKPRPESKEAAEAGNAPTMPGTGPFDRVPGTGPFARVGEAITPGSGPISRGSAQITPDAAITPGSGPITAGSGPITPGSEHTIARRSIGDDLFE